jgi:ATP-dependent Clp protease protease subunit
MEELLGFVDESSSLYEKLYTSLLKERIIYLNGDIDDNTVDMVTMQIILASEREKDIPEEELKPLTIYLNTRGGDIDPTLHLVQVIQDSRIPIHVKVLAMAASAGLYITIACKYRVAYKNSILLLHKGSICVSGNTASAEDTMDFYKGIVQQKFDELIINRTKITSDELKKIRRNETYCLGEEAKDLYGFIDEVI